MTQLIGPTWIFKKKKKAHFGYRMKKKGWNKGGFWQPRALPTGCTPEMQTGS